MGVYPLAVPGGQHPVDRMAVIKQRIAELEREYAELREGIIAGQIERHGRNWSAYVHEAERRSIRIADAERMLDPDTLAALVNVTTQTFVNLVRRRTNRPRRKRDR